jgi:hypothetical protein
MEDMRNAYCILIRKPETGRDNSRDLSVDGISVRVWAGLIWLKMFFLNSSQL